MSGSITSSVLSRVVTDRHFCFSALGTMPLLLRQSCTCDSSVMPFSRIVGMFQRDHVSSADVYTPCTYVCVILCHAYLLHVFDSTIQLVSSVLHAC